MKRSVDMHFVQTCIIIFIFTFTFFNQSLLQKKFVKVIEGDIYDNILEIYKRTEKVVLVKFVEIIPFSGSHSFQWKPFVFVEAISFDGSRFIQWKPFLLVEAIPFSENISCNENITSNGSHSIQWKSLVLVETIRFSGNHSF